MCSGEKTPTFSCCENLSFPFPHASVVLKCIHYGEWWVMNYEWHFYILTFIVLFPWSVKDSWLLGWMEVLACSQRNSASSKRSGETRDERRATMAQSKRWNWQSLLHHIPHPAFLGVNALLLCSPQEGMKLRTVVIQNSQALVHGWPKENKQWCDAIHIHRHTHVVHVMASLSCSPDIKGTR